MRVCLKHVQRLNGAWRNPGDIIEMDDLTAAQYIPAGIVTRVHDPPINPPAAGAISSSTPNAGGAPFPPAARLNVLIPSYNRAFYLAETINSVVSQLDDVQPAPCLWVADDGSTDATVEVLEAEIKRGRLERNRVITISRENRPESQIGPNTARKLLAALIPEDEIIIELDDHDLLAPGALKVIATAFADPSLCLAWGGAEAIDLLGRLIKQEHKPAYTPYQLRDTGCWAIGIRAYRKATYAATGGWRVDECPCGDFALLLRMEKHLHGTGIRCLPELLTRYREGEARSLATKQRDAHAKNTRLFRNLAKSGALFAKQDAFVPAIPVAAPAGTRVAVVIPHYGGPQYLAPALETLTASTSRDEVEIIVVDNGSYEQCEATYEQYAGQITVLRSDLNLGWVGGVNKGLAAVDADYVLVSNDDVLFPSDFGERLATMTARMKEVGNIASISPCRLDGSSMSTLKTLSEERGSLPAAITTPRALSTVAEVNELNAALRGTTDKPYTRNNDVVLFCVLCRADVLKQIGGLCELYGLGYADDVDYTRRAEELGYRHETDMHTFVYHEMSKTFRDGKLIPKFNEYHITNRKLYDLLWKPQCVAGLPVLFTTYNRLAYTKQTLPALLSSLREGDIVVAIDNASSDGTQDYLREMEKGHPSLLRVVLNETNRGVAGAMNQFFAMLRGHAGKIVPPIVAKVDNDTLVAPGWATELMALFTEADVIQPAHYGFGDDKAADEGPVRTHTHVGGSCVLIRTSAITKPIAELGLVRGWTSYQKDNNLNCAIALDMKLELLDATENGESNADHPRYTQRIWADRALEDRSIVAGLRVHNDADRYLPEVLKHLSTIASKIVVLDDASTDGTRAICEALPFVEYHCNDHNQHVIGEGANRTKLYHLCAAHDPSWIVWLDSDEMFEPAIVRKIYSLISGKTPDAYFFNLHHLWDNPGQCRVDGEWGGKKVIRLFKYRSDVEWELPEGDHCGPVPGIYHAAARDSGYSVLHLGFLRRRDQFEKCLRHLCLNTGKDKAVRHFLSMLDGEWEGGQFEKWTKGLPVDVFPRPTQGLTYDWTPGAIRRVIVEDE